MMSFLAALLVAAGLFGMWLAQGLKQRRRVSNLKVLLESTYMEQTGTAEHQPAEIQRLLARTGMAAEYLFARASFFRKLKSKIEHSNWTVTAGEFVAVSVLLGAVGAFIGFLGTSAPLAVLLAVAGLFFPYLLVSRAISSRKSRFEDQLPEVLDLLAASLESGAGVAQALELVVAEADDPAAEEFARVLSATRLGSPIVEALKVMSVRLGSRDLNWTIQAIIVQQRTGGKLADVLRIVAGFMRGREEVKRELKALTAEGKLSAFILGGLPFALAGFLLIVNPDYLTPLFTTAIGIAMLVITGTLMLIGFFIMSRIIKIDV